jgi:serine/threonine protein kinase
MPFDLAPDETLLQRLPLPLAQLYRRAHNAKTPLERHLTAFSLWEASLKLLASVAIVEYAHRTESDPHLGERLQNLARPQLGHWWEFVRLLVPLLADQGQEGFHRVRDLVLGRTRDDFPRAAGLDAALREALGSKGEARATVRFTELFDRLVQYRNKVIGHGSPGQIKDDFSERMARALLAGMAEFLGRLDILAGRRLLYIAEVRQVGGVWLVQRYELAGENARRIPSLELPHAEAARLPYAERLHLDVPAAEKAAAFAGRLVEYRSLHPLLVYDAEAEEVLFLNARRGQRHTEYLCYTTGRTVNRPDLGTEQRELMARVLGMAVEAADVEKWTARSQAEEPNTETAVSPTRRTLGEFELLSELGRGGMGVVYRAWQPSLGRQVGLKKLLHSGDRKTEARFRREIRALGKVDHPHLIKIYLSGADGDQWFYAMELVEGANLAVVCDRLKTSSGSAADVDLQTWQETLSTVCLEVRQAEKPLSDGQAEPPKSPLAPLGASSPPPPHGPTLGRSYVRNVVELVHQMAEAAHALHEVGIVHRDIKPGNIMVTADGRQAVLMDLGLAQLAEELEGRLTLTREFVGTLRYASPEQVLAVGKLDRRTDVYSLGATLWELLTLQPMFGATEQTPRPELMQRIQYEEPARLRKYHPGIARDLDAIVLRCLEKDPKKRYASSRELAEDLQHFLTGEPVRARPVGDVERLWRWCRRNRLVAGLLMAVFSSLLLGTLVATFFALRATASARQALKEKDRADRKATEADENARQAETNARHALEEKGRADRKAKEAETNASRTTAALKFLLGLFEASDPIGLQGFTFFQVRSTGEPLTAHDILQRGTERITRDIQDQPEIKATLLDYIGNAFRSLGDYDQAGKLLTEAIDLRQKMAPKGEIESADTLFNLGWLHHDLGDYAEAEHFYRMALAIRVKHLGKDDLLVAVTQFNLAWLLTQLGDFDQAEPLFTAVIKVRREKLGENHRDFAIALAGLAALYLYKGEHVKALGPSMQAIGILLKSEGNKNLARAYMLFPTGVFAREREHNYEKAKRLLSECRDITKKILGEKHIAVAVVLHELALTLADKGEDISAEVYFQECLKIVRETVGLAHPMAIHLVENYARVLLRLPSRAANSPYLGITMVGLMANQPAHGSFLAASTLIPERTNTKKGMKLFQEFLAAQRLRFMEKEPILVAEALTRYGVFLLFADQKNQAQEQFVEALSIYRTNQRSYQPMEFTWCLLGVAEMKLRMKDFAGAESLAREAVLVARKQYGEALECGPYPGHVGYCATLPKEVQ